MRTIYIDSEKHCHPADTGGMTALETAFFDSKADFFVEGYRCDVSASGVAFTPWKSHRELLAAQAQYERDLDDRADLEAGYNYLLTGGADNG